MIDQTNLSSIRFFLIILVCFSCHTQRATNRISVQIPTIEQEATSIWRTINDIGFFEQQGYTVSLPKHELIDSLIAKSKAGDFGNGEYSRIYQLLESGIYDKSNYQLALLKVQEQTPLINEMIQQIEIESQIWGWEFDFFDTYELVFTLYGSGGSYDPNTGRITLFTTAEGGFKNYPNPANTIIHEITHLGMERTIVQKYQLDHGLKERIIDTVVYLLFGEQLPDYQIQHMGDKTIDEHLKRKDDLGRLHAILAEIK